MDVEENQMGLFEVAGAPELWSQEPKQTPASAAPPAPTRAPRTTAAPAAKPAPAPPAKLAAAPAPRPTKKRGKAPLAPADRKVSGLVPQGDVRLTANVRQDLHLKLKIASAYRRTTIGEIIEELIDRHL
jgi:pyruvate/2-oxoglutarate dehydrogenase complex dihydrolipoamide acyltransferase (E2) component